MNYKLFISTLLFACLNISACTSEENSSVLELQVPTSTRMDATTVEGVQYRADISVNSGTTQTYFIDPTESPLSIIISEVRAGESNLIDILWYVVLDDNEAELSRQSQLFFADGNTHINAIHTDHDQFDFDQDGVSNLRELGAGTCLWTNSEPCVHPDSLIPDPNNIIFSSDFSVDTSTWWATTGTRVDTVGQHCVTASASAEERSGTVTGYGPSFVLDNSSTYRFSFDARAQFASEIAITVAKHGGGLQIDEELVELSSTLNRYSYTFETGIIDQIDLLLVFHLGSGMENFYCFDNVVLQKLMAQ